MKKVVDNLYYTNNHEWIKDNNNGTYTLGITEYAQEELGDLVFIELPEVGSAISKEDEICVVESVKTASDICAPCDLKILEVNTDLEEKPELVNKDCYKKGWFIKFSIVNSKDLENLISTSTYKKLLAKL